MKWLFAFLRLIVLAFVLSLFLGWLKGTDGDLARTLPWTLFPVSGGMVAARVVMDWEERRRPSQLLTGAARIIAFLAFVGIAHWGFPGSLTAIAVAFLGTLALGCYQRSAEA